MEGARARLCPWLRGGEQARPRRLGPGSGSPHRRAAQGQSRSPGSPSGPSTGPGRRGHSPGRAAPGMPALLPAGGAGRGAAARGSRSGSLRRAAAPRRGGLTGGLHGNPLRTPRCPARQ